MNTNVSTKRRVVITGIGTLNPLGNDVTTTWHNIAAGNSGIGSITLFDATHLSSLIQEMYIVCWIESLITFFTSMLTGQRALDRYSYQRLKWHIKEVLR